MTLALDRPKTDTDRLRLAALVLLAESDSLTLQEANKKYELLSPKNEEYLFWHIEGETGISKITDAINQVLEHFSQAGIDKNNAVWLLEKFHEFASQAALIWRFAPEPEYLD